MVQSALPDAETPRMVEVSESGLVVPLLVAAPHTVGGPDAIIVESTPVVFYFSIPVLIMNCNIGHRLLPLHFACYTFLFSTC